MASQLGTSSLSNKDIYSSPLVTLDVSFHSAFKILKNVLSICKTGDFSPLEFNKF